MKCEGSSRDGEREGREKNPGNGVVCIVSLVLCFRQDGEGAEKRRLEGLRNVASASDPPQKKKKKKSYRQCCALAAAVVASARDILELASSSGNDDKRVRLVLATVGKTHQRFSGPSPREKKEKKKKKRAPTWGSHQSGP